MRSTFASAVLLCATLAFPVLARAAAIKVGYVDLQRCLGEIEDGKRAKAKLKRIFDKKRKPIVVDNLTLHVCPECGQESMPLKTARAVEKILKGSAAPIGQFSAQLYSAA
jgi:hypothetical protein